MKIQLFTWIFLIPFAVAVFGVDFVLVSGQCQSDQQALLLRLNASLEYDPSASTKLAKWNLTADCCQWMGVVCDQGGRVLSLDLSNESISGGFEDSSALFGLRFLSSLNLSFNNFNTSIPPSFANLTNLVYLNLSSAGFLDQIPIQISSLTRLVSLDLSTFSGSNTGLLKLENPNLETLIQSLGQLTELVLDGVNISAKGNQWCQALSSSVLNLQVLSLSRCFLSGPIHPSLAKLHSLSVIRLSNNNFTGSVPEFFVNFSNLSTLKLSFCDLTGNFPKGLFQIPTLEELDLRANRLLKGSFPTFPPNLSLRTLLLGGTSFSGILPLSIGNLGNLTIMDLTNCNFSGPIPNTVANLTQISHLDLSFNMFTGSIPPLHMSKNLTDIDFWGNQLTGDISSTSWESLQSLVYVNLGNNSFTGYIPSTLLSIPSLQKVWLSSNQFRGTIPDFSNATSASLDTLDLSHNKLEGDIPSSIFDLQSLKILSLSFNKFKNQSMELHKIWRLSNLTTLDLSYCNLSINASGSYPNFSTPPPSLRSLNLASCSLKVFPDLRTQSLLIYLDLSDNQIVGFIPNWISEVGNGTLQWLNLASNLLVGIEKPLFLPNLNILDLHNNQLQGNIPPLPPLATYVDYSSNKFNSTIPINIGDSLPFTYFFSLTNNSLTGVIPQSLCNAFYLKVLDLSHNNLNGTIPDCLIDGIQNLGVLNLRRNKFEGNVPDVFPDVCKLQTLDLNGNRLEGKVPKSLVNCTVLEVLNLGNNQMEDTFPCILKDISTLRVLVLRGNKFYGGIICPQHYVWPRLQIVDLASNIFSGPLPSSFLETFKAMTGDRNETAGHLSFNPLQLTPLYYQDSITVTNKGVEMEFVKILRVFTSIDFSSNRLDGNVPETMGQFRALLGLNLSHNALTGPIPSSFGNLSQLESLDLSSNQLHGPIPGQLASLNFLGFLNVSNNRLVGKIPLGNQLQTFSAASFEGNDGLCGPPLSACFIPESPTFPSHSNSGSKIDWTLIAAQVGFIFGLGIIIMPLVFSRRWRMKYYTHVDGVLYRMFPQLEERSRNYRRKARINRRR